LTAFYLGIFIFAEGAFVLMAVKEYLQDLLQLGDYEQITGRNEARSREVSAPSMPRHPTSEI
jgi:hypothetical protein